MLVYQRKGDTLVKLNLGDGISYEQIVSLENAVKAAASAAQAAKESADSKLPLAGGTMSNAVNFKLGNIDSSATDGTVLYDIYMNSYDKNNVRIAQLYSSIYNDGAVISSLNASRMVNGKLALAYVLPCVLPDGKAFTQVPTYDISVTNGYAAVNKTVADRDYLRLDGGTLIDNLYIKSPNFSLRSDTDTLLYSKGISLADNSNNIIGGIQCVYNTDKSIEARFAVLNKKADNTNLYTNLGVYCDVNGNTHGMSPAPQENSYANHIDTLQASINRHPVRLEVLGSDYKIFVGGANASNSKDLWQGRGTSPEMPFASLISVANYIRRISGQGINLTINIQDDLYDEPSCTFNDSMFGQITIQSVDNNIRTIHGNNTKYAFRYGKAGFNNINFSSCYFGSAELGILLVDKNVGLSDINIPSLPLFEATTGGAVHFMPNLVMTVSGTAASFISANAYGNASLNPLASITGNLTGKKYNCAAFGRIFSGGKGANAFPGSVAGTTDSTGQYV